MQTAPPRILYLVRHGETEWNAEQRMQGQLDSSLNATGRTQADVSGRFLAASGIDRLYASPLGRVRETAAFFVPHLDLPPRYDDRLMEWSCGDWSGLKYSDIRQRWPDAYTAWEADRMTVPAPGGETFLDLLARAESFLDEFAPPPGKPVAIVAHGVINRALACVALGWPPARMLTLRQDNNVIFRLEIAATGCSATHYVSGDGPFPGLPSKTGPILG